MRKFLLLLTLCASFGLAVPALAEDPPAAQPAAGAEAAPAAAAPAAPAPAAEAPKMDTGSTAWMITAAVLVILMTIPGLALFYGGLVRTKNMLSVLMWVFYSVCIVTVLWVLFGYSLAFSGGSTPFVGGLSKAFLSGITPDTKAATFSVGA